MSDRLYLADLHVHSHHSSLYMPQWFFRQLEVAECYTPPLQVYALAKARGMNLVTITDHDTIDGALEIASLEGTFIGVEITTRFPEEPGIVHVVALGLTEAQYRDIRACQENLYDLVDYLNRAPITHYLAHPFFSMNAQLSMEALEKLFLLFKNMEGLNGSRVARQSDLLARIARDLTPARLAEWADRHQLAPVGSESHRKTLVGGSDDHAGLGIARAYTASAGTPTPRAFLDAIDQGLVEPRGEVGTSLSLATSAYGVAYRYLEQDDQRRGSGNVFQTFFSSLSSPSKKEETPSFFSTDLRKKVSRILLKKAGLNPISLLMESHKEHSCEVLFEGINELFNEVLGESCQHLAADLQSLNLERMFQMLGQIASAHFFLTAYYASFKHQNGGRNYLEATARHFGAEPVLMRRRKIAVFSDCAFEVNGVALSLRRMLNVARVSGYPMMLMTSAEQPAGDIDGLKNFKPVAAFPMPHYPELSLSIPPLLEMLRYCELEEVTAIQISTPGPVGLAGLLVANLLELPAVGFYHTNLPDLVRDLTGDPSIDGLARVYTSWFYRQMDSVFASSHQSEEDLVGLGVERSRLRLVPRGVDLEIFHPQWRDDSVWKKFRLDGELKLLYVGRMSKEKNLDVLVDSFKQVTQNMEKVCLVMVGDGPYRTSLERALSGYPACFTGALEGEALSKVYASADLFAFPSSVDTFGNVVLEAQASGLPVVVSAQGGAREQVLPGRTGVVAEGRANAFAREIQHLLEDVDRREGMGKAARIHAERRGLREAFAQMWEMYP